jgi:hypothetical protein
MSNYTTFLSLVGNTPNTPESLAMALVSDAKLAFVALTEIQLRNTGEGGAYSFSRRDRGVARALVVKYNEGEELTAEDVLSAVTLAYRYRKQIATLIPKAANDTTTDPTV